MTTSAALSPVKQAYARKLPINTGKTIRYFMEIRNSSEMIEGLRQRNPAIIKELLNAYGNILYGNILRIVESPELAEEVLQETFVKVWKNAENYNTSKGRLSTWLLNLARYTAIDATRTAHFQHCRAVEPISDSNCEPVTSHLPLDYLDLSTHVTQLGTDYRTLIELAYFEGYTQEEISEKMGLPLGTVKTRLRSALEKLRKIYPKCAFSN